MLKKILVYGVMVLGLCQSIASADVVTLITGKELDGVMTKVSESGITLLYKNEIHGISYAKISAIRESAGPRARNSTLIEKAVQNLNHFKNERGILSRPAATPGGSVQLRRLAEIYIKDSCPVCHEVIAFLGENHIPYRVYDIDRDEAAKKKFLSNGGRTAPLTVVNGRVIHGFDRAALLFAAGK